MKNTMKIQTGTRKVKQTVRRFTDEQKHMIVHDIDNRPKGVSKTEMFEKYGMSNGGNLYYVWRNKGFGTVPMNRKVMSPVNVSMNSISIQQIVIDVSINSVDGLLRMMKEINKIKGVKSVSV
jgi:hypothetical protein